VLRLYCGENRQTLILRQRKERLAVVVHQVHQRERGGNGSRWVLLFIWLKRQSCTTGVSSHR
jgi:hypothetical protein